MDEVLEFLDRELLGSPLRDWAIALGVALGTFFVLLLVRRVLRRRLERLAQRTSNDLDDLVVEGLRKTMALFLLTVGVFLGAQSLALPERTHTVIRIGAVLVALLQAGRWGTLTVNHVLDGVQRRRDHADAGGSAATFSILKFIGLVTVWALVLLVALQNMGFDVTALLAGLGVGGVAVALAAQSVLGDLFASIAIALDKPFQVGDFLIVGDHLGTVERIGIKTTRLRSLWGELLIFSNTDLLGSRIRNYGHMKERRVCFGVGVTYQTPRESLERAPGLLKEAVESQGERVRFDRAHFKAYGASSLDFEVVYYVLSPDYNVYMDVQQAINLAIHEAFGENDLDFAYPTRTLFVQTEDGDRRGGPEGARGGEEAGSRAGGSGSSGDHDGDGPRA